MLALAQTHPECLNKWMNIDFTEQERLLSVVLIRGNGWAVHPLSPNRLTGNPSISLCSQPFNLWSNLILHTVRFAWCFGTGLVLTLLSTSDFDWRGLECCHVPRDRVSRRRSPRHVLISLLHCAHTFWKLYPLWCLHDAVRSSARGQKCNKKYLLI